MSLESAAADPLVLNFLVEFPGSSRKFVGISVEIPEVVPELLRNVCGTSMELPAELPQLHTARERQALAQSRAKLGGGSWPAATGGLRSANCAALSSRCLPLLVPAAV